MRTLPEEVVSLLQYIELNNSNWWDETVDRSVLAILWLANQPYDTQKIKHELETQLGSNARLFEIQNSVKRLSENGLLIHDHSNRYSLSINQKKELNNQVDESKRLESRILDNFVSTVWSTNIGIEKNELWILFKEKFLVSLVSDLGIRVYEFFTKKREDLPWVSHIDNFLKEIPQESRDEVRNRIMLFMNPDSNDIASFILNYLDAYLLASAYGLSAKTIESLKTLDKNDFEFIVFLDTNVIFSLLDLHTNPSNETVVNLMELIKANEDSINTRFVVSSITLKEINDAINYYCNQLNSSIYPQNLAEAARVSGVSGVFNKYFERVKDSGGQIRVKDYFDPYLTQMVPILNSKGVELFPDSSIADYESLPKVFRDIDTQKQYEDSTFKGDAKGIDQITKDIVLWHFVQDLRPKNNTSPISEKYWILTIDNRFLSFDRFKKKGLNINPICIHPTQLIQLLRFFIPSTPQVNSILIGTIVTPLLSRGLSGKAEQTIIKILNRLARYEGIEDVPVDVISKMLADENLRGQLEKHNSDEKTDELLMEKFSIELVESLKQNLEKDSTITEQKNKIEQLQIDISELIKSTSSKENVYIKQLEEQGNVLKSLKEDNEKEKAEKKKREDKKTFVNTLLAFFAPYVLLLPTAGYGISILLERYSLTRQQYFFILLIVSIVVTGFSGKIVTELVKNNTYAKQLGILEKLRKILSWEKFIWLIITYVLTFIGDCLKSTLLK